MSDYTINITVAGQDQASAPLREVQQQLKGVGDAADSSGGQTGGFFSNLLSTAGGFLAANVIGGIASQFTGFISGGIADARDAAIVFAQTEAAITSTGGAAGLTAEQIADMASSMSAAAGKSLFGDDEIQRGQNVLLTFTEIGKDVFPLATQASIDMAQALHKTPEAMTMMLGKALNSADGFAALKKSGVAFTDSQEEQIKALFASGHAADAQRIILGELNKEFGGSALAAAKADGGMAQFKDQLGELGEQLGGIALPLINQLVGLLISQVMPAAQQAANWLGDHLPGAITLLTNAVGPVLEGFSKMGTGGGTLGKALGDLSAVWTALQPVITNVVNAISAVVMAVFGVVQTFIQAHGKEIAAFMTDAWTQIMEIVKVGIALYNAIIPPVLTAIAGFITAHGATIQRILGNTWDAIKALIDAALTLIRGVLTAALQLIQGDWSGAWETIKTMSARIVTDLGTVIKAGLDNLVTIFTGVIATIKEAWNGLVTSATEIGANIINNIISGVQNGVGALADAVRAAARHALQAAKDLLGLGGGSGGADPAPEARASGGPVGAGQTYLVGEQGPELFVPRSNGAIFSTPSLAAALGGGGGTTYNQTVTILPGAIVVQAAPGMNAEQVARDVIRILNTKLAMRLA